MAVTWHLSDEGPRICTARERSCPKGGQHYKSEVEAECAYSSQFQHLSSLTKGSSRFHASVPFSKVPTMSEQELKNAGFRIAASGSRSTVVLDEKNGVVLKWRTDGRAQPVTEERESYRRYLAKKDEYDALGLRYAETEFHATVDGGLIVVQEYVHPALNMPYDLYDETRDDRAEFFDRVREEEIDRERSGIENGVRPIFADVTWHDMFVEPDGTVVMVDALYDGEG